MRVFHADAHRAHHPRTEVVLGRQVPAFEVPERADAILSAVSRSHPGATPPPAAREALGSVHEAAYLTHLETAWGDWIAAGGDGALSADTFLLAGLGAAAEPASAEARMGRYTFDASTPILEGTWEAALAAAGCALAAADTVAGGERAAYALCRPPGHHAGRAFGGGYCYLNNAALAATRIGGRIAILDLDYHHGNGTQQIFWDDPDVLYVSLHADPDAEYPYYTGRRDETGGPGAAGATRNLPLPAGSGDAAYLEALDAAVEAVGAWGPAALVVSLGTDASQRDPMGRFDLTDACFSRMGERAASLGLHTVVVQEGGYDLGSIGELVVRFLAPLSPRS